MSIPKFVQMFDHNGKKIIFENFSGLKDNELKIAISEVNTFISQLKEKNMLVLIDVTSAKAGLSSINSIKNLGMCNQSKIKKSAILGITGLRMIVLKDFNKILKLNIKPFLKRELALNWLAED